MHQKQIKDKNQILAPGNELNSLLCFQICTYMQLVAHPTEMQEFNDFFTLLLRSTVFFCDKYLAHGKGKII